MSIMFGTFHRKITPEELERAKREQAEAHRRRERREAEVRRKQARAREEELARPEGQAD